MTLELSPPLDIADRVEAHVAEGEWGKAEALLSSLRQAIESMPAEERETVVNDLAARFSGITAVAAEAKIEVEDHLDTLRRGKAAKQAYASTDRLASAR